VSKRAKASSVIVRHADGSTEVRPAYRGRELWSVLLGKDPHGIRQQPARSTIRAAIACCSHPTRAQQERLAELRATHADVAEKAAAFRQRWPRRPRPTIGALLDAWETLP
jgi:hypothetical protein